MLHRKLSCLVMTVGLALPVWAGERPGSISGHVRSTGGVPQMGAMVEGLGSAVRTFKVFTDANGFYSASGLLPGVYKIRVSSPSFLPALRDRVALHAGNSVVVNVTLSTLFDAVQLGPWRRGSGDEDDWKWVLRSASIGIRRRPCLVLRKMSTMS